MKTKKELQDIKLSEIMTTPVESLSPVDTIKYAVNMMLDCKVTTVPVIDGHSKCIGILSRSDLTEMFMNEDSELSRILDTDRLSLEWLNRTLDTGDARTVKELMTYEVTTIRSDQRLTDACREMARLKIHHLPVVDERDTVVGIVSAFDIVLALAKN